MDTKHTATPWKTSGDYRITTLKGETIAKTIDSKLITADKDAAYIVKAVNSHEALVKACTKLQQIHTDYIADKHGIVNVQVLLTDIQEAYEDAEQALKLAGEE